MRARGGGRVGRVVVARGARKEQLRARELQLVVGRGRHVDRDEHDLAAECGDREHTRHGARRRQRAVGCKTFRELDAEDRHVERARAEVAAARREEDRPACGTTSVVSSVGRASTSVAAMFRPWRTHTTMPCFAPPAASSPTSAVPSESGGVRASPASRVARGRKEVGRLDVEVVRHRVRGAVGPPRVVRERRDEALARRGVHRTRDLIGHGLAQRRRAARAQATRATNFTKEIRAIATHQYLTCVDLKNCYPTILTDMFPDIAELKYYDDHRDEVLAETMRHYGVSRDAAK